MIRMEHTIAQQFKIIKRLLITVGGKSMHQKALYNTLNVGQYS